MHLDDRITFKQLSASDISLQFLANFQHRQHITQKWVRTETGWKLEETELMREWSDEKREWVAGYLRRQIERGGCVQSAFCENELVAFGSIDGLLGGANQQYANLTMLFVDDRWQRRGIGQELFARLCAMARQMNAQKLFISAIPSKETIAFYMQMGCKDAEEVPDALVDSPDDRYMERIL